MDNHMQNGDWLEAAISYCIDYIEERKWDMARDTIADMRDFGFCESAGVMEKSLLRHIAADIQV